MGNDMNTYWITWEDHRRSRELALALDAKYIALTHQGKRNIRYPILAFKTVLFLIKNKAEKIYCQNPSIVLNSLLCLLKVFFKFKLISDRHSNFKFNTINSKKIKWKLFHFLSNYTLKNSDLTIVTNQYLKEYIEKNGAQGFVLQDKLPLLSSTKKTHLGGQRH